MQNAVALVLLAAITTLVLAPSIEYDFLNLDDTYYIHDNSWLRSFSLRNIASMFGHHYNYHYHPLTIFTYMLEFQLFGLNPAGYHATNIMLHVATALLLFGLLRLFSTDVYTSFILAQLFAVHPLRVESVVWISERKDVLCALFYLAGLCLWVLASKVRGSKERELIGASIIAFLLAALSKAMAVSFPFVVILNDLLCHRERVRSRIPAYLLLLLMAIFFSHQNMLAQREPAETTVAELKIAAYAPFLYAVKTLLPRDLAALYPMEFSPTNRILPFFVGCVFCVTMIGLAFAVVRRHPKLTYGILASGIVLLPVSGIITVASVFAADRFTYLPTAILFTGIAPILSQYLRKAARVRRLIVRVCFVLLTVAYASVTLATMSNWSDGTAAWTRVLTLYPNSRDAKRLLADVWSTKAQTAIADGQIEAAEQLVEHALEVFPADQRALRIKVDWLLARGERELAEQILSRARVTHGATVAGKTYALGMIGIIARSKGEMARADSIFREVYDFGGREPTSPESRLLALLAVAAGDTSRAMRYYERSLEQEPLNKTALSNLGLLCVKTGEETRGFLLFHRACELYPDDPLACKAARTLAMRITAKDDP